MKSRELLIAGILSVLAVCGLAEKQQPQRKVNQILEAKPIQIGARNGPEGLRNLIDSGLLQPVDGSERNKARRLGPAVGTKTTSKTEATETRKLHSRSEDNYSTDDGYDDDLYVGNGLYVVSAFQDSRFNGPPIIPDPTDPDEDEAAVGTVYLFKDAPIQNKTAIDESGLLGLTQGTCTRTQNLLQPPGNDMDGKSYCQFTYEFIDNFGTRYASFTAEGAGQGNFASLTVTGGLGELEGVSGNVELYVATLDFSSGMPRLVRDESANDFLAMVEGYDMYAYLNIPSQGA